jgi:hypothetical protein
LELDDTKGKWEKLGTPKYSFCVTWQTLKYVAAQATAKILSRLPKNAACIVMASNLSGDSDSWLIENPWDKTAIFFFLILFFVFLLTHFTT